MKLIVGDAGWLWIVCESANARVCQYQVMISSGLFEEINEQNIFSRVF